MDIPFNSGLPPPSAGPTSSAGQPVDQKNDQDPIRKIDVIKILHIKAAEYKKLKLNPLHVILLKIQMVVKKIFNKNTESIDSKLIQHNQLSKSHKWISKIDLEKVELNQNDLIWLSQIINNRDLSPKSLHYLYKSCKYTHCQHTLHTMQRATECNDTKEFVRCLNRLPKGIRKSLYYIASNYVEGTFNEGLGKKELHKNTSILFEIKTLDNQNIYQQMDLLLLDLVSSYKNITLLGLQKNRETQGSPQIVTSPPSQPELSVDPKTQKIEAKKISKALSCWFQQARKTTVYDTSIDQLTKKISNEILSEPVTVAMVGIEYAGLVSQGGLAEAIQGMAQGILKQNPDNKVKLVFPYYSIISDEIREKLTPVDQFYDSTGQKIPVFLTTIDGVECYFIADESFILDKENPNIYDKSNRLRFFKFSNLAADVLKQMNGLDVIHLHDWHVAGVALKFAKEYSEEWKNKNIPPPCIYFS